MSACSFEVTSVKACYRDRTHGGRSCEALDERWRSGHLIVVTVQWQRLAYGVAWLSADQIERLNTLTPAAGERHDEGNMAVIDR
jgi:hypothetical protein